MSDDQIAAALGRIEGKQDSLIRWIEAHEQRHHEELTRADDRHRVIDNTLVQHAADINQAKGAKGAVLAMTAGIATAISIGFAAIRSFFKSGG